MGMHKDAKAGGSLWFFFYRPWGVEWAQDTGYWFPLVMMAIFLQHLIHL